MCFFAALMHPSLYQSGYCITNLLSEEATKICSSKRGRYPTNVFI